MFRAHYSSISKEVKRALQLRPGLDDNAVGPKTQLAERRRSHYLVRGGHRLGPRLGLGPQRLDDAVGHVRLRVSNEWRSSLSRRRGLRR